MERFLAALIFTLYCITTRCTFAEGDGKWSPNPVIGKQDAFIESEPIDGKVFLYPWVTSDRMGDWYYNRAYCACHGAEMVTLHNQKEHDFFYNFMVQVGMRPNGVWLGAQSLEKARFTHWHNNEVADYQPVMPGEYNEPGLTCVDMSFYLTEHKDACEPTITITETELCFCVEKGEMTGDCNLNKIACRHSSTGLQDCSPTTTTTDSQHCVCVVKTYMPGPTHKEDPHLCLKTNDLLIVLDSSDSITHIDYKIAKNFINRLVTAFMVNRKSRVSFTTYSTDASLEFSIKNTLTAAEISDKIVNAAHLADGTNTNLGISTSLDDYKTATRNSHELVNMVLLTDGKSKDLAATTEAVRKAHDIRVRTFAVGIGSDVNQDELLMFANGDPSKVFSTATFSELIKILAPVSRKLCTE